MKDAKYKRLKLQGSYRGLKFACSHQDKAGFYHVYINNIWQAAVTTLPEALEQIAKYLKTRD